MKAIALFLALAAPLLAADHATSSGIPLDAPWKLSEYEWATVHAKHPAWGLAHGERDYHLAVRLAKAEGWAVDTDALLAAALVHDVGGLAEFEKAGVDHGVRSAEVMEPLLASWGFPMAKWPLVREIIVAHVYYGPAGASPEAKAFRDADILDFLGAIGVARLASATPELGHDATLATPFDVAAKFADEMPAKLTTNAAKAEVAARVAEMRALIQSVRAYTLDGTAY